MKELVVATGNVGKLREIRAILPDYTVLSQKEAGADIEVEETGTTFAENALLKARAIAQATGRATIADDSGLEVDALNGAPGVYSARYAGEGATDADRVVKLLHELEHVPEQERGARFVSVIAYVDADGKEYTFEGTCEGQIIYEPRGENGFGYDPVFYVPAYDQTFAELAAEVKNAISHRFRALEKLKEFLG